MGSEQIDGYSRAGDVAAKALELSLLVGLGGNVGVQGKAASLAAKSHQALAVAILAPDPQEAVLHDAAIEEFVELTLHVVRQRTALIGYSTGNRG